MVRAVRWICNFIHNPGCFYHRKVAKWVKKCGNRHKSALYYWFTAPFSQVKNTRESILWGVCCSNLLVHTESTHSPTSSVSADWPVELVFGLAEHSDMKKDILCRRRVWPGTALCRGCMLLHDSICWVRSGVWRRTRSCSSQTDVRTAEREAATVSVAGRNSGTSVDFISCTVCFKRFTWKAFQTVVVLISYPGKPLSEWVFVPVSHQRQCFTHPVSLQFHSLFNKAVMSVISQFYCSIYSFRVAFNQIKDPKRSQKLHFHQRPELKCSNHMTVNHDWAKQRWIIEEGYSVIELQSQSTERDHLIWFVVASVLINTCSDYKKVKNYWHPFGKLPIICYTFYTALIKDEERANLNTLSWLALLCSRYLITGLQFIAGWWGLPLQTRLWYSLKLTF